jgi:hypothetical protein
MDPAHPERVERDRHEILEFPIENPRSIGAPKRGAGGASRVRGERKISDFGQRKLAGVVRWNDRRDLNDVVQESIQRVREIRERIPLRELDLERPR